MQLLDRPLRSSCCGSLLIQRHAEGSRLGAKPFSLDLISDMPGEGAHHRLSVTRCANPHNSEDRPNALPSGMTTYLLSNFIKNHPPPRYSGRRFGAPPRLDADKSTSHQSVRVRGRVIAVIFDVQSKGLSLLSQEQEMGLQLSRWYILFYWAGTPNQQRQTNHLYGQTRIGAAKRGSYRIAAMVSVS